MNYQAKKFTLFIICLFCSINGYSQTAWSGRMAPDLYRLNVPVQKDTIIPLKKNPWLAAGEVVGLNLGVWAFDRYILHGDWAYISGETIKRNFEMGFFWDNDNFQTNLFNHPYHGSLYFGAARSNGMNYWQSGFFSLGGSLMWELFMECELPSKNDLMATSIGGMALGETFFRLSDLFIDERATGWERFGREALGVLFAPTRGLTRLINGDAWRKSPYRGKQFPNAPLSFQTSVGWKVMELRDDAFDEGMGLCIDLGMVYGDLYQSEDTKPYDYFTLRGSFNLQKNQPLIGQINLIGRLWGKEIWEKDNNELHLGIFQHYDYYDSDTISDISNKTPYEIGTPACFGTGLIFRGINPDKTLMYRAHIHANGIILGGSFSDYYFEDDRSYNWGSGYSIKLGGGLNYKKKLSAALGFEHYHVYTWKGYPGDPTAEGYDFRTSDAQGNRSNTRFNILNGILEYHFNQQWSVSLSEYMFVRRTNYDYENFQDVSSTTTESRLAIGYKF